MRARVTARSRSVLPSPCTLAWCSASPRRDIITIITSTRVTTVKTNITRIRRSASIAIFTVITIIKLVLLVVLFLQTPMSHRHPGAEFFFAQNFFSVEELRLKA